MASRRVDDIKEMLKNRNLHKDSFFRLILFRLFYKILMSAIGIYPRAGVLGQFPVVLILEKCRIKGPQGTYSGFDRMNPTAGFFIEEDTETVRTGLNGYFTVSVITIISEQGILGQTKKVTDSLNLTIVNIDAAFSITALTAHFALKSFHKYLPQRHEGTKIIINKFA